MKNILLFVCFWNAVWAQEPFRLSFNNVLTTDGLASNTNFALTVDQRGYLWASSPVGLTRFDGSTCKVYNAENSALPDGITNVIADMKGRLWVSTANKGLFQFEYASDSFRPIRTIPLYKDSLRRQDQTVFMKLLAVDKHDKIWYFRSDILNLCSYDIHTHQEERYLSGRNPFGNSNCVYLAGGQLKYVFMPLKLGGTARYTFINDHVVKVDSFLCPVRNKVLSTSIMVVHCETDSIAWMNGNLGLLRVNLNTNRVQHFAHYKGKRIRFVNQIASLGTRYLLVSAANDGLLIFDKQKQIFVQQFQYVAGDPKSLLKGKVEMAVCDQHNNLFVSVLGGGICFTNLLQQKIAQWFSIQESIRQLPDGTLATDNSIYAMARNEAGILYAATALGVLGFHHSGKICQRFDESKTGSQGSEFLRIDRQQRIWIGNHYNNGITMITPKTGRIRTFTIHDRTGTPEPIVDICQVEDHDYIAAGLINLYQFKESNGRISDVRIIEDNNQFNNQRNLSLAYHLPTKQLFVLGEWGGRLFCFRKQAGRWKAGPKNPWLDTLLYVRNLHIDRFQHTIWVSSTRGLFSVNPIDISFRKVISSQQLSSGIKGFLPDTASKSVWFSTDHGIAYGRMNTTPTGTLSGRMLQPKFIKPSEGAYSTDYTAGACVALPAGYLAFGGNNGITVIRPASLRVTNPAPKLLITQFTVNEKPDRTRKNNDGIQSIALGYDQNTFSFQVVGMDYGDPQGVEIQYQLDGYDKAWISSPNPAIIRYVNIESGAHLLRIRAINSEGTVSHIRTVQITIQTFFTKTWWFRTLIVAVLLLVVYGLYRMRINQIRADEVYKTEIADLKRYRAEAEIKALRSQMNPHFIFNCMNTVDSYILLNKSDEASDFLQKFSKLIRLILENSRQEFIALREDLEALRLYIGLEQQRYSNCFSYRIDVEKALLEKNYLIPSMLLQPFVENAILHGLRNKKNKTGQLVIQINKQDNHLIARISDNGIGRTASAQLHKHRLERSQSLGTKVTAERIEQLNEQNRDTLGWSPIYLKIDDVQQEGQTGTVVTVGLPCLT